MRITQSPCSPPWWLKLTNENILTSLWSSLTMLPKQVANFWGEVILLLQPPSYLVSATCLKTKMSWLHKFNIFFTICILLGAISHSLTIKLSDCWASNLENLSNRVIISSELRIRSMTKTKFKTSVDGTTRRMSRRQKKWRNFTVEKSLTVTYIHGVMLNLIDGGQPLGREIVQTWWTAQPC